MLVNLMNVLCAPDPGDNLLSVHSMTMHGANVIFPKKFARYQQKARSSALVKSMKGYLGLK